MTSQGGDFGEQAHGGPQQPSQRPGAPGYGHDFIPPAYAGQPPSQPEPSAPPGPVPPWNPPPSGYPPPTQPGSPYPPAPPQYGPPYPSPGYGGGYGAPPGYPNPYDPYQLRSNETNGLAIGSLATSIAGVVLGIPLSLFCWLGILIPIVGAVLGGVALNQIKRTGQRGRGIAIAGIAVGATAAVLLIILVMAVMAAFTSRTFR